MFSSRRLLAIKTAEMLDKQICGIRLVKLEVLAIISDKSSTVRYYIDQIVCAPKIKESIDFK